MKGTRQLAEIVEPRDDLIFSSSPNAMLLRGWILQSSVVLGILDCGPNASPSVNLISEPLLPFKRMRNFLILVAIHGIV